MSRWTDRELDAEIQKALGYEIVHHGEGAYYYIAPEGTCGSVCKNHEHMVPHYSSDPDCGWMLLEEMLSRGWNFVLAGLKEGEKFACGYTKEGKLEYSSPYYKTMAEAMCKEALRALSR